MEETKPFGKPKRKGIMKKSEIIYLVVAVLLLAAYVLIDQWIETATQAVKQKTDYLILHEDTKMLSSEPMWFEYQNRLYVYDDESSCLHAYDDNGDFWFALQLHHSQNGEGRLAVIDDKLHVENREDVIFVLNDDKVEEVMESPDYELDPSAHLSFRALEARMEEEYELLHNSASQYSYQTVGLIHTSSEKIIISSSAYLRYLRMLPFLGLVLALLIARVLILKRTSAHILNGQGEP